MESPHQSTNIDHNPSLDTNNNNSDLIPIDILNEILRRLPAKSIAKFVTISKSWAKIIRSNYFINSFSSSQKFQTQQQPHRLLFAINQYFDFNWSFFTSSEDENPPLNNEKPPLKLISHIPKFYGRSHSPIYVNGLVNFRFGKTQIVSNPSTGKSIVLPVVKGPILSRFFGFDPINGEYKVLCIIGSLYGRRNGKITFCQNQVLTVGSNGFWREIDLWIPHRPRSESVCIDGIIYYLASYSSDLFIVRFDVKTEKFLKQLPCLFLKSFQNCLNLINYKSKLAIVHVPKNRLDGLWSIDLWVLEDVEKVEWLKIRRSLICGFNIEILGTTGSGDIVYIDRCNGNLYVIYQNDKKFPYRIIHITPNMDYGQGGFKKFAFIDYVESVMLL